MERAMCCWDHMVLKHKHCQWKHVNVFQYGGSNTRIVWGVLPPEFRPVIPVWKVVFTQTWHHVKSIFWIIVRKSSNMELNRSNRWTMKLNLTSPEYGEQYQTILTHGCSNKSSQELMHHQSKGKHLTYSQECEFLLHSFGNSFFPIILNSQ